MNHIFIDQVSDHVDKNVRFKGWITHTRPSGKLVFLEIRDGTGMIQCVVFKDHVDENVYIAAKSITIETSLIIDGIIKRDKRSTIGFELNVSHIEILHQPVEEYPISTKNHGPAFLHENRHLWIRSKKQTAILKIRSNIIKYSREYFDTQGFIAFDAPILTQASCEGTTMLFETRYFDEKAYLSQSGQLYNEAGALALGRVYSLGPTFRAEKSKTRRHLTEFWMIEPEAAFFDLKMIMELAQNYVAYIISKIVDLNKTELDILERNIIKLENITIPFPEISYDDAINILRENNQKINWGEDFGAEEESILSNHFEKPVMIKKYPASCKAFYMKNDTEKPDLALCYDMLAPEGYGEIIGGGQREDDYFILKKKIMENNLNIEDFNWYLDLRKYGSVPHAGFGLGIERTVAWICGLKHVRETIPFPRLMDRIRP